MFDVLENICPADHQQNLSIYQTSCIYDGSALLTYQFDQLSINADSIINDPKAFFTDATELAETVLEPSTYYFMVSSVRAAIHECFIQSQNISISEPVWNVTQFYGSLPGCSSYCKYPGASCSSDGDCQLSLTFEQLIGLTGSSTTIYINFMFLIVCLLILYLQ